MLGPNCCISPALEIINEQRVSRRLDAGVLMYCIETVEKVGTGSGAETVDVNAEENLCRGDSLSARLLRLFVYSSISVLISSLSLSTHSFSLFDAGDERIVMGRMTGVGDALGVVVVFRPLD